MTETINILKVFESFILGKCLCGCNKDINIIVGHYLKRFSNGHNKKVTRYKKNSNELVKCGVINCNKMIKRYNKEFKEIKYCIGHSSKVKLQYKDGDGYIRIKKPNHPNSMKRGYILEHRLILSEKLGRPLRKGEDGHHDNEIKDDNRSENIILMSHGNHTKLHNENRKNKINKIIS